MTSPSSLPPIFTDSPHACPFIILLCPALPGIFFLLVHWTLYFPRLHLGPCTPAVG